MRPIPSPQYPMDPVNLLPAEDRNATYPHPRHPVIRENPGTSPIPPERLHEGISRALDHLLSLQSAEGYWVFNLEADVTIPSEYILLQRFPGRAIKPELGESIGRYIRRSQHPGGGWPLYADGFTDSAILLRETHPPASPPADIAGGGTS